MTSSMDLLTEKQIEEMVIGLVAKAQRQYGIPEQCSGQAACLAIGLPLVRRRLVPGMDGLLNDDQVVVSTEVQLTSRVEYTVFDEIMHFLLIEDGELYDYLNEVQRKDPRSFDATIERWCQMGAAEFLIPRSQVNSYIAKEGYSVDLIERIANINGASIAATAIQLAVCAPVDCYVVICRYGRSPVSPHGTTLYVEQATRRLGAEFPMARGTMIPPDHLFREVWESRQPLSGPSYIPFRSGKTYSCEYAEARMIGNQVVGILYLGHRPGKGQLGLDLLI